MKRFFLCQIDGVFVLSATEMVWFPLGNGVISTWFPLQPPFPTEFCVFYGMWSNGKLESKTLIETGVFII